MSSLEADDLVFILLCSRVNASLSSPAALRTLPTRTLNHGYRMLEVDQMAAVVTAHVLNVDLLMEAVNRAIVGSAARGVTVVCTSENSSCRVVEPGQGLCREAQSRFHCSNTDGSSHKISNRVISHGFDVRFASTSRSPTFQRTAVWCHSLSLSLYTSESTVFV